MRPILAKDWLKISNWEGGYDNCSQLFLLTSRSLLLRQQLAGVLPVAVEHIPDQVEGGEDGRRGRLLRPVELETGTVRLLQLRIHIH